jgi:membrane-bound serine protease (ClpP class)
MRLVRYPFPFGLALLALLVFTSPPAFGSPAASRPVIPVVRIKGIINPVVAGFVTKALARANAQGDRAFLLELDTPGGLDTSMRAIIQAILGSKAPVIVYVYPSGARAASAGALITLSADFAVMAPGTNIGAAHPVSIGIGGESGKKGGVMMEKVLNDAVAYARSIAELRGRNVKWAENVVRKSISTSAVEALKLKVIDLVADSPADLLKKLDGRTYLREGHRRTLHTRGVKTVSVEMGWRQGILDAISNPDVAYMLLMLGILGIFFEIAQPGVILPGSIGAIALLLALFGLQTLPINYVGVLLILLGVVLFILEIKVTSYGMLTVGGIVSLSLGSLMLIESSQPYLQISRAVIAATVAVFSGFFGLAVFYMIRTHRRPFVSGAEGMAGERGEAITEIHERGRIFVHGEYWDAFSTEPIPQGATVRVVRMGKNMRLEVEQEPSADRDSGKREMPEP